MARDDWRLRIELGEHGSGGLLGRLGLWSSESRELAGELKAERLAVTEDDGTVFVYGGSSLELEQARGVIERELDDLGARDDAVVSTEHWLEAESRWDDDAPGPGADEELLERGYAPWEVRIAARDHAAARALADQLEGEGFGVVRRWTYVIAGCASEEQARELAARLHGEVEPGGELVWESSPWNPFAVFGGLGDAGGPI